MKPELPVMAVNTPVGVPLGTVGPLTYLDWFLRLVRVECPQPRPRSQVLVPASQIPNG